MVYCRQALLFQAQLTLGLPTESLFILREIVPERNLGLLRKSDQPKTMLWIRQLVVLSSRQCEGGLNAQSRPAVGIQRKLQVSLLTWKTRKRCSVETVIPSQRALSYWKETQSDVHYACCIVCCLFDRAGSKRWHLGTNVLPCSPSSLGGRCSAQADSKRGVGEWGELEMDRQGNVCICVH